MFFIERHRILYEDIHYNCQLSSRVYVPNNFGFDVFGFMTEANKYITNPRSLHMTSVKCSRGYDRTHMFTKYHRYGY